METYNFINNHIAPDILNNYLRILANIEKKYLKLESERNMTMQHLGILRNLIISADKARNSCYPDLVRILQIIENNDPCYDTGQVELCGQEDCLWRGKCDS